MLRTRFTDLIGLDYPAMSAPMSNHSGGTLAAAVSKAGGLGTFGGTNRFGPDWLREQMEFVRSQTTRPFGVGFITHMIEPDAQNFETALAEGAPVVIFSFADPRPWLCRARDNGAVTICQVQSHKRYLDEMTGTPIDTIWDDIPPVNSQAKERMGYATQKPLALMERIISASSNPGDVVLDPFAGCATTMEAAHKLGRQWIGIDIAIHAVKRVARVRLTERLGLVEGQDFTVEGVTRTVEGAQDLWERDKYHFQKWAVEQVEGFVTTKRSADGGIDGRVYFAVPRVQELQSMVVEVKGGANVSIRDLRALKGILDYDTALMAGLIVMQPLGTVKQRNFDRFMADAGSHEILGIEYPKMQMLTVGEILDREAVQDANGTGPARA